MKILVVGKGGREHALVTALRESQPDAVIFSFPGSDAIFQIARPVEASDLPSLVEFMARESVDLCVAGEESYLVTGEGLSNACARVGIPCWGPPKEAARLEASKEFAKEFMVRHGIPTGGFAVADDAASARAAIAGRYPTVLKFDGLAAGKGVAVCLDEAAAEAFLEEVLERRRFGPGRLLVEEYLEGPEISVFASVVDESYQILAPARDYKRLGDGDTGPNTGGMGAVSSLEMFAGPEGASLRDRVEREIVRPTVEGLARDGLPYRGFLYFGIMLTGQGPKILEYNCRFGDPEAQAVLPMITGDFAAYVREGAEGRLNPDLIGFRPGWSVCVVAASAGYPDSTRSGDLISGLDAAVEARVFHAGTRKNPEGGFETAGGRVLAVVARGDTRAEAVERVYRESAKVSFPGMQRRGDIGTRNFEDAAAGSEAGELEKGESRRVFGEAEIADAVDRLAREILATCEDDPPALVGIYTRGITLAKRVAEAIRASGRELPLGTLDISLYRDDFGQMGDRLPSLETSEIPFALDDRRVILFDEVIYTGRTTRAALDGLMDYGRPRKIELAVLVDRGCRELPIQPDYTGVALPTEPGDYVQVRFREDDGGEDGVFIS